MAIKLFADPTFEIPDGDGYWSKLLNRSYRHDSPIQSPSNRERALDPRSHQGFTSSAPREHSGKTGSMR